MTTLDGFLDALADAIADRVVARIAATSAKPFTSDPRRLNLPAGWSKRTWDDAGRLAEDNPKRPPMRKDPRGYSCPVDAFEAWATSQKRVRRRAPAAETDEQRRARQLADLRQRTERRDSKKGAK